MTKSPSKSPVNLGRPRSKSHTPTASKPPTPVIKPPRKKLTFRLRHQAAPPPSTPTKGANASFKSPGQNVDQLISSDVVNGLINGSDSQTTITTPVFYGLSMSLTDNTPASTASVAIEQHSFPQAIATIHHLLNTMEEEYHMKVIKIQELEAEMEEVKDKLGKLREGSVGEAAVAKAELQTFKNELRSFVTRLLDD